MKRNHLIVVAALAAAAFAAPASAQLSTSGLYVGLSSGQSHFKSVCTASPCDDRDTNGSLFAGYQFARFLAAEVAWRYFGHARVADASVKANAIEADAVFTLPFYRGFSLLGRAGVFHGNLKGNGADERKNGATFGLGGQYDFERAAVRLEWQRHADLGGGEFGAKTDIDSINLAALFRFR